MPAHHRFLALASLAVSVTVAVAALNLGGSDLHRLFGPGALPARGVAATGGRSEPPPGGRAPGPRTQSAAGRRRKASGGDGAILVVAVLEALVCLTALAALAALLLKSRLDARETRDYALFEVHLSMHDAARPRDLKDMVEGLAAAVREWPVDRARHGQPYFAVELHYGAGRSGMEFLIALRCERDLARTLESIIAGAYPDVRVGETDGGEPAPIRARLRAPGHVLRLRKARPFVYSLAASEEGDAGSPPLEAVAQAQAMAGVPSSVRLQFTPAPLILEGWARRRVRAHERRLVAGGQVGAGAHSVLDQEELRSASRVQNSSLLWCEIQVAAATGEQANRVAAPLVARRGENSLHRRRMVLRQDLYRRRFASAYPPLVPTLGLGGFHSIATAAEVAHLLTLPTARMRAVPIRRLTIPRLPPPPEIARTDDLAVQVPAT